MDFRTPLREQDLDPDPFRQFAAWFADALGSGVPEPEAAALATATSAGAPSVRMVLVKRADERGFRFFTNFDSRKGRELAENPHAALLFHWQELRRQIRLEGAVQRLSEQESSEYVRSRSRGSRLSALASPQSQVVADRSELEERVVRLTAEHEGAELPIPSGWGGFRLEPEVFEFWQHGADRLHDRLEYVPRGDGGWELRRLAP